MRPVHERTPLLDGAAEHERNDHERNSQRRSWFPPLHRVYFTSLIVGMTFSFTQTALIYSFRTMTCDDYYSTREWEGRGDRCSVHSIESKTARSVALMSSLTTGSTLLNLFTTAWFISRFGVKAAMFQQTFWAALRNMSQIYAQTVGGATGIAIIQTTQLFNALGSAGGFQLCANSFVAMLSDDEQRTANFGVLGGIFMFGSGLGYTAGGVAERLFGYLAPFQCAFVLLCFSTVFGMFFLPDVKNTNTDGNDGEKQEPHGIFTPLKVFVPRKRADGRGRDWSLTMLGFGTFFAVLATGYVPMMLQLVATNVFGFTPDTSGYMLSLNLLVRGFFLMQCFPPIIASGRRWLTPPDETCGESDTSTVSVYSAVTKDSRRSATPSERGSPERSPGPRTPLSRPRRASSPTSWYGVPTPPIRNVPRRSRRTSRASAGGSSYMSVAEIALEHPDDPAGAEIPEATGAPVTDIAPPLADGRHGSLFDLLFLRYSILLDGILTGAVTFATSPWHMYLAAGVLPFASGTGPASKGVTLEFVPPAERPDALSAIALVEKLAQVSTIGLFGYTFSCLSDVGMPTLVFAANAAVALLAFFVLLPVRLPSTPCTSHAV